MDSIQEAIDQLALGIAVAQHAEPREDILNRTDRTERSRWQNDAAMRHGRVSLVLVLASLFTAGCTLTPSFSAGSVPASLKSEPESHLYYPGSAVQSISGQEGYCHHGSTDAGWVSASVETKLTTSAAADAVFKWYDSQLGSLGWPGTGGTLRTDVMEYYRGAWPPESDYTSGATFVIYNDGHASGKTEYRTLLKVGGQSGSQSCAPAH